MLENDFHLEMAVLYLSRQVLSRGYNFSHRAVVVHDGLIPLKLGI